MVQVRTRCRLQWRVVTSPPIRVPRHRDAHTGTSLADEPVIGTTAFDEEEGVWQTHAKKVGN